MLISAPDAPASTPARVPDWMIEAALCDPPPTPQAAAAKSEHAARLAQQGFRVFPLEPDGKKPLIAEWPGKATTDKVAIRNWWALWPTANIGVATGRGLFVLDADCKGGKRGLASLDMLDGLGLPESLRVTTPTGGVHVYLRDPDGAAIANSVSALEEYRDIDVRGENGYVVGPGSTIAGVSYAEIAADAYIELAPRWIVDLVRTKRQRSAPKDREPLVELDTDHAIERVTFWLKHEAPPAIAFAGGNNQTYETACWVRGLGLSAASALDVMLAHYNERCEPSWDPSDLQDIVDSAYRSATGPWGGMSALADFDVMPPAAGHSRPPKLFSITVDEAIAAALEITADPLIDGIFECSTIAEIFGPSTVGKSFVALDLAYHIAAGRPWEGRAVKQSPVVYIAAEGGRGFYKRVKAIQEGKNFPLKLPMALVPCAVHLLPPKSDIAALAALLSDQQTAMGPLGLVVIDTLKRTIGGADENSGEVMGAFIDAIASLQPLFPEATFLIIHHTGKDISKGARGHYSLYAAVDTEIEILKGKITNTKHRDGELFAQIAFELERVEVGSAPNGRKISSCIVRVKTGSEFMKIPLSGRQADLLDAFDDTAQAKAIGAGMAEKWQEQKVSWPEWISAYATRRLGEDGPRKYAEGAQNGNPPSGFDQTNLRKLRNAVVESGHVQKVEEDQYVRS